MLEKYTPDEPIAAVATALSPAALGIVRTSGKGCIELVGKLFSRPAALNNAAGYTIVYGWLMDNTKRIDEVLVSVFRAPRSFTGEDMVEISCHGGPSVVTAVHKLLLAHGFRQAEHGEFTFRAYVNGKTDLTKAEAVREIIDSRTDASRGRAAGRLAGSLYEEIDSIKKLVIDTLASIEVEVEYPEDEETISSTFDRADIEKAVTSLQILADSWKSEKLYQDGARIVLCGRTNAGKSSLFNAVLKEDRAIVSDVPGTTRDWLESWASFDGIPVRLFDTAGLRETSDIVEKQGVELTRSLTTDADVVLYLIDSDSGFSGDDELFLLQCSEPVVIVWNKCDKSGMRKMLTDEQKKRMSCFKTEAYVSAKNGSGIADLLKSVKNILTEGMSTERIQAGLGSARQKTAVEDALECLKHSLISADENYTLDAVVQDLEDALESLGEVTGEVTPDDVLGSIFSHFCVGK
ncbi:MAG: tRNA uridine-5-carboxymethylaminomethyl(34) synthesis GTPase MnmE [Treponema sp.]|nr:tRNA uridine-5-carboxymethylaminomethyl(34) synthesis GTPase MnmE [Treponema sp.]